MQPKQIMSGLLLRIAKRRLVWSLYGVCFKRKLSWYLPAEPCTLVLVGWLYPKKNIDEPCHEFHSAQKEKKTDGFSQDRPFL